MRSIPRFALLLLGACGASSSPDGPDATTASACEMRADTICTIRASCYPDRTYTQAQLDSCIGHEIEYCAPSDYQLASALECADVAPELDCQWETRFPESCSVYP